MNQANGTMPTTNTIAEQRRGGGEAAVVDQPLGERRDQDAADRQAGRRDRQRHRPPLVEPAGDDGGRRHQTRRGERHTEHAVHDEQLPLLLDLAEQRRGHTADQAAGDDDVAHVEAGDHPGHRDADDATDDEEERGGERDRLDRPALLVAERVEVDGEAVEAEPRRRRQDDEAAGDDRASRGTGRGATDGSTTVSTRATLEPRRGRRGSSERSPSSTSAVAGAGERGVAVGLELHGELGAAARHDPAVGQDVHVVGLAARGAAGCSG